MYNIIKEISKLEKMTKHRSQLIVNNIRIDRGQHLSKFTQSNDVKLNRKTTIIAKYGLDFYKNISLRATDRQLRILDFTTGGEVLSPHGVLHKITNISEFCRNFNLTQSSVSQMMRGELRSHKGWRKPLTNKSMVRSGLSAKLKTPTGEIVTICNQRKFCKENNLTQSSISKVISGKLQHHKGWTLVDTILPSWKIQSPSGVVMTVTNQRKFCKDHGLGQGNLNDLLYGRNGVKTHKGWKLP